MPIQKSPETGALPAMATRQCQKSGNGFPPDADFLPLILTCKTTTFSCGSELARDGGGSVSLDVECQSAIASKLAPTGAGSVCKKSAGTKKREPLRTPVF
jgi:hypothetical protein